MKELFNDKKKRYLIIGISLSLILMIIGTTYAYFSWQSSNNPIVNITVDDVGDIIFKGGNEINATNIGPVLNYNDGEITEFYFKKKTTEAVEIRIYITPTVLPDNLKEESFKVKLLSSTDNVTYTELAEDNFKDKDVDTLFALSTIELTNRLTYFKIIFYIDGNMYNPNTMQGNNFNAIINITNDDGCPKNTVTPVYTDTSGANAPVLAEGMIPVIYDEGLGSWIKADTSYGWYNYSDKMWANAVMVKTDASNEVECSKSRSEYMNAKAYTPILEADILAYFVWIPRYKYKLFNATYTESTSAQVIDVVFESGTKTTGKVSCTYNNGTESCTNKSNGNYYTHPAFTFGSNNLEGIWVGKFETTGTTAQPTSKPSIVALRQIPVSQMYNSSLVVNSSVYLEDSGIQQSDSHMMKNVEWGAVAYLKQSTYGLGLTDIGMNNNSEGITGCGAAAGSFSSTTCDAYNTTTGMLASTTGNVTGIYDMSGGTWEYVMGNYAYNTGSSGLTVTEIPSQNIDIYSGTTMAASHLGDAIGETSGWYGDNNLFFIVDEKWNNYWINRGGIYFDEAKAGMFTSGSIVRTYGDGSSAFGFRIVLATTK